MGIGFTFWRRVGWILGRISVGPALIIGVRVRDIGWVRIRIRRIPGFYPVGDFARSRIQ